MRLIDADELKEAMEEHTDYKGYLVCAPEEVINLAPTVERPHGEWIFKNGKYRCTACGEKAIYRYNGMSNIPKEILTDFCYNCGSDNRKRGETE